MWIVPKNLLTSLSVQDTEVLTSDSPELSTLSEQSLMWRSKPSPSQTWSRRWKREGWLQLLSGRILKPSTGAHFAEKWTSSLEAFLANHSPLPEVEEETKIPDTCGPTSPEESELSDLPLFSWRTLKASSAQNSKEITGAIQQEHQWLSMSSANWKEWVIKQRLEYSQRKRQALLTKENASSSWRSPTASQIGYESNLLTSSGEPWTGTGRAYRPDGTNKQHDLSLQVIAGLREEDKRNSNGSHPVLSLEETETPAEQGARWATPLAGMSHAPLGSGKHNKIENQVQAAAEQGARWATPHTAMSKAPCGGGHGEIVQYRIENQVQDARWATPRADIKRPQGGGTDKRAQSKIENQVQTPPAEPQVQTPPQELNHRNNTTSSSWKTPTVAEGGKIANQVNQGQLGLSNDPLLEQGKKEKQENYRGYLNPRWVETLMGVPVGWCDPLWNGDPCSCTNRYEELRLLGNGVVPATAEVAIRTLLTKLLGDEA